MTLGDTKGQEAYRQSHNVSRSPMRYRLVAGGKAGGPAEQNNTEDRAVHLARREESGSEAAIKADQALMQAIADGEEDAFARLIDAEAPRLTRFVSAVLSDVSEAEEIVQETLLRLWKNAARWEPQARVGTYLHRIAYRLSIDRLRRRRPHVDIDDFDDLLEDGAPSPERHLTRLEDVRLVHEALDRLPDRQRAAIVLAHFQELPQVEAAAVMGVGEHAYESLLARGRRRLRQLLAGQEEGDGEDWTGS